MRAAQALGFKDGYGKPWCVSPGLMSLTPDLAGSVGANVLYTNLLVNPTEGLQTIGTGFGGHVKGNQDPLEACQRPWTGSGGCI